jgi:hypothetical protein
LNPISWIEGGELSAIEFFPLYRFCHDTMFWFRESIALAVVFAEIAMTMKAQVSITWQNLPSRAFYAPHSQQSGYLQARCLGTVLFKTDGLYLLWT